jgi:hypothetical protein
MPRYKAVHVKEQGVDLIIVPLDSSFGSKGTQVQQEIAKNLQLHAEEAKLAGTVVPVWLDSSGRMGFLAPQRWHPFFASLNYNQVLTNLNVEIFW